MKTPDDAEIDRYYQERPGRAWGLLIVLATLGCFAIAAGLMLSGCATIRAWENVDK